MGVTPPTGMEGTGSAAGVGAAPLTGGISSSSITLVHTSIDSMLAQIGGGVQNDSYLRMIIALLILNALLNSDHARGGSAVGLPNAPRPQSMASMISMHSETNCIQIQEQSVTLASNQAVQTTTAGGDSGNGGRVDLHV
jgi:hypothetical protein